MRFTASKKILVLLSVISLTLVPTLFNTNSAYADSGEFFGSDGNDDAQERDIGTLFDRVGTTLALQSGSAPYNVGLRFPNINIPAGATIDSAAISLVKNSGSTSAVVNVYAEDIDNSPNFLTNADVTSRVRTTAVSTNWTIPATNNIYHQSPSIAAAIQEVIDRPGWNSGNAITIIVVSRTTPEATSIMRSRDDAVNTDDWPKLNITWSLPTPPVADFSAEPLTGEVPLEVVFTDSSSNTPTSWEWDFDNDGGIDSTEQNPTHTYNSVGTFSVSLNSINGDGNDEEVKTDYITVEAAPENPPTVRTLLLLIPVISVLAIIGIIIRHVVSTIVAIVMIPIMIAVTVAILPTLIRIAEQ